MMKVKIFDLGWSVDRTKFEEEINTFLATLPKNAVKHVQSSASTTRTGDSDQMDRLFRHHLVRGTGENF
jgi:hypothetical protein